MDVGATLEAHLTDGRTVGGTLTFGDIARAEAQTHSNYMTKFKNRDDVTLTDLAVLSYQVARRVASVAETFDEWLLLLDTFTIDAPDDAEEEAQPEAQSFPLAVAADS